MSSAVAIAVPNGIRNARDPVFLDNVSTLRGIATHSMLAFVSGEFGGSGPAAWYERDDNDTTSADNGDSIIVSVTGKRWKKLSFSTGLLSAMSFIQRGASAVIRDAQEKMRDRICILDFIDPAEHAGIRAGTSTVDCLAPLHAAIASRTIVGLGIQVLTGGPEIFCPTGKYNFSATIHHKIRCHIKGEVSGTQGGWSTHFVFPADVPGVVVHKENTNSTGTVAATTGADGTVYEDILFYGNNGATLTAHGFSMRARAVLVRCCFQAFAGNGIHIVASAGGGGFLEGNANCFYIENCTVLANKQHGLFTDGADSNAGTIIMLDASQNLGWGVYDSSFLGNCYVGCHSADNTLGPYKSDGANARNTFLGCYAEGGQPPSDITNPAMIIGGIQGSGVIGTGAMFTMDIGGVSISQTVQAPTFTMGLGQPVDSGVGLRYQDTQNVAGWTFEKALGRWAYKWANAGVPGYLNFYDLAAKPANGYARDISVAACPSGGNAAVGIDSYYAGNFSQMKWRGFLTDSTTAIPAVNHLVGDYYDYLTPVAGGFRGKACVTAGNPGTFQEYGLINGGGGAVVQGVSKATGVTLNTRRGEITLNAANLAAGTRVQFTLTNNKIGANDTVIVHRKSGGTASAYLVGVDSVAAGSCVIFIKNDTAGALAEAPLLQFEVRTGAIA